MGRAVGQPVVARTELPSPPNPRRSSTALPTVAPTGRRSQRRSTCRAATAVPRAAIAPAHPSVVERLGRTGTVAALRPTTSPAFRAARPAKTTARPTIRTGLTSSAPAALNAQAAKTACRQETPESGSAATKRPDGRPPLEAMKGADPRSGTGTVPPVIRRALGILTLGAGTARLKGLP